jgi:hypothetical protein
LLVDEDLNHELGAMFLGELDRPLYGVLETLQLVVCDLHGVVTTPERTIRTLFGGAICSSLNADSISSQQR